MAFSPVWRAGVAACVLSLLSGSALASPPSVSAQPEQFVVGTDAQVTFSVRAGGPLRLLASAASVGLLTREPDPSPTEARFRWTPPATRYPQVALLAFWVSRADGPPEVTLFQLPIVGRTDLNVTTAARATVHVEVAGKLFGPVQADGHGRAKVPVEVPPGATNAKVLGETAKGRTTSVTVPLAAPPVNPLLAAASPDPLPSGGQGWLWILHSGKLNAAKLQVTVQGGNATRDRVEEDRALYTLSGDPEARKLVAVATLRGDADARAQASVEITEPPKDRAVEPSKEKPPIAVVKPMPAAPPGPSLVSLLMPAALVGGFYGGGENRGLAAALDVGCPLPWTANRLLLELEVGVRLQSWTTELSNFPGETITASVLALPVELDLRFRVLQLGRWNVDLRAGGGLLPFRGQVKSALQPTITEADLGGEAFAAAQVAYRMGAFELFFEVRGAYSPATSSEIHALPGGVFGALGARFMRSP